MGASPMQRSFVAVLLALGACSSDPDGTSVPLPDGSPGIGFDDLRWSPTLGRVLAPGGRSGALDLVAADTGEVTAITGFSKDADYSDGHDFGATSVDEGEGFLFVTDRTTTTLAVV